MGIEIYIFTPGLAVCGEQVAEPSLNPADELQTDSTNLLQGIPTTNSRMATRSKFDLERRVFDFETSPWPLTNYTLS